MLAESGVTMSQLNGSLHTLVSTPEYRPHCPDDAKTRVIDGVAAALAQEAHEDISAVDGIRVRFSRGWGLLRASNTEPVLSLRFEGETEVDANRYRDLFFAALRAYPEVEGLPAS
jgi:phosphomannomutase/phosphoglucomutase